MQPKTFRFNRTAMKSLLNRTILASPWLSLGLLLLPGGSVLAFLFWWFQHRHQEV